MAAAAVVTELLVTGAATAAAVIVVVVGDGWRLIVESRTLVDRPFGGRVISVGTGCS